MWDKEKKKAKLLKKQLEQLNNQEEKLFNSKEFTLLKDKIEPIKEKIEEKIPEKLQQTLQGAFEKGFDLVFSKGLGVIEKSYDKDKKHLEFEINHYRVSKETTKKHIRQLDKEAKKSAVINQLVTTAEGGALGFLGIGLPDVPVFIGMILRNIYEMSLSYGFSYEDEKERIYVLYLICTAVTKGEEQKRYSLLAEQVGAQIDQGLSVPYDVQQVSKETAQVLSDAMLMAKFIQGFMVVGAVGGISNYTIMNHISKWAKVKYKKRYIYKLLKENN